MPRFAAHYDKLYVELIDTAAAYGLRNGLPTFDRKAYQRQASTSLADVAKEVLHFGYDVWPGEVEDECANDVGTRRGHLQVVWSRAS